MTHVDTSNSRRRGRSHGRHGRHAKHGQYGQYGQYGQARTQLAIMRIATSWLALSLIAFSGMELSSGISLMQCCGPRPSRAEEAVSRDRLGAFVHTVRSPFQNGETRIRVLVPKAAESEAADKPVAPRRVIYVLPVEAKDERRYGDGLAEIHKLDLHNRHGVVFVAPEFSQLPWYADHPTDDKVRQESYFIKSVVPLVEQRYRVQKTRDGRLLLGFSKSGWGAWTLLLRHPDLFERAAAWDAPLMMDKPGKYGSGPIFGTDENFAHYEVSRLVAEPARLPRDTTRLILTGYGNFRSEHQQVHALLEKSGTPHFYRDGPSLKHDWHSGWVSEAVELLLSKE